MHKACTVCRHTDLLFAVRDWTRLCYVQYRIKKYPDSPSSCYRIWADFFFPLWIANSKISGFATESAGCVWTEAVSGEKKFRIQKYPDICVDTPTLKYCTLFLSKLASGMNLNKIATLYKRLVCLLHHVL